MTTSADVRIEARHYVMFAALAPLMGVAAYTYDGIFVGATWTRAMRNLMVTALAIYLGVWWATRGLGNTGLWIAILTFLAARGMLQAINYPRLVGATFNTRRR
jgi:MATE family multidrug resistance protein